MSEFLNIYQIQDKFGRSKFDRDTYTQKYNERRELYKKVLELDKELEQIKDDSFVSYEIETEDGLKGIVKLNPFNCIFNKYTKSGEVSKSNTDLRRSNIKILRKIEK